MKLENRSNQNVAAENLIGNLGYKKRKIQGAFLKFLKSWDHWLKNKKNIKYNNSMPSGLKENMALSEFLQTLSETGKDIYSAYKDISQGKNYHRKCLVSCIQASFKDEVPIMY